MNDFEMEKRRIYKVKGRCYLYEHKVFVFLHSCPFVIYNSIRGKDFHRVVFKIKGTEEEVRSTMTYLADKLDFETTYMKKSLF